MRRIFLILCAALAAAGCSRPITGPDELVLTVYVAPYRVDCTGVGPQECMLVRLDPDAEWTRFHGGIEGFTYEPGFAYELLVRQRTIANPPQDGSSVEWRLVAVVARVPAADPDTGHT